RIINYGLYRIKAGTVIDGEEGDASFRISASTYPSAHGDFLVNGDAALEYVGYRHNAHNNLSVNSRKKYPSNFRLHVRWLRSFTPITYLCKIRGNSLAYRLPATLII